MKILMRIILGVFLVQTTTVFSANAAAVPVNLVSVLENKTRVLEDFGATIAACVGNKDTRHSAFNGCIDWHSSVHGVWSLIAIMQATGSDRYEKLVNGILSPEKIAREFELIRQNENFEMPYGRAWFLRLAIDHKAYYKNDKLTEMADYILLGLIRRYEDRPIQLLSSNYQSDSWALINMLDYTVAENDLDQNRKIKRLALRAFHQFNRSCSNSIENGKFMAVCTNLFSLASRAMNLAEFIRWYKDYRHKFVIPTAVSNPVNWHHFGLNFSRAWGLWDAYQLTGEIEFADAYAAHVKKGFQKYSEFKTNYNGVGHWVAQFGVFALQPLFKDENQPAENR